MNKLKTLIAILLLVLTSQFLKGETIIDIFTNNDSGQIQFAVGEVQSSISATGNKSAVKPLSQLNRLTEGQYNIIFIRLDDRDNRRLLRRMRIDNLEELTEEGYIIHKDPGNVKNIYIIGKDEAGVMYGGLEVAEIIRLKGFEAIDNDFKNPYMKVRGTKFNIPLDVRTPTYTEPSDAAQNNMAEMWNFEFWTEYIDNLARYRYNTISIWNLHPFPSMVKVPEYPDIALDDVRKSTVDWEENYSLHGRGFDAPEIVNNYEVIKEITIDEKIDFWRKVMAYGKQRNVQFFIVTWNIWIYGTEGKYGITDQSDNPITTDYFRKSIKQLVLTYPDLAGIGITTGENMYALTPRGKVEWAYSTYGLGVLDALEEQPDRKFTVIHRQHETTANEIKSIFQDVINHKNINFVFSFKYAEAHVYSSVVQVFHHNFVEDIEGEGLKTLWTLRNDDNYYFRWGAPDFVRDFINNIPYDISEGFYYGSDQYVWGREFLGKNRVEPRELEILKHWYKFMIWGRLGYDPGLGNDRFIETIQSKFPTVNAAEMFDAWQNASMIYPWVTGFHWGRLDFQWYIESGQSQPSPAQTPSGYHDVNRFISLPPHQGTGYVSIPEFTKAYLSGSPINGESPFQVADKIQNSADLALSWAYKHHSELPPDHRITIDDIKTIAYLGKYYSHKIRGATYLALFRETFEREYYLNVINELNLSAGFFRRYAAYGMANYHNPLWTNRVGIVDWKENFEWALYDITANGGNVSLSSMNPTQGGIILEAEDAEFQVSSVLASQINGFTGNGYLATRDRNAHHQVKWNYNASEAGRYMLEFRYTLTRQEVYPSPVVINGVEAGKVEFWNTGHAGAWVWERIIVDLKKGENSIAVSPMGWVLLDHLNIIKM
jgi:hypothetical protein